MSKIYIVGSLRNELIPEIAEILRSDGHEVFDDWYGAGEKADDSWRSYEINRGRPYTEAIRGKAATNICAFDRTNIMAADTVILVLPAGKSGHLELGLAIGAGKKTHILLDKDYERWDVMYALADHVHDDIDTLRIVLNMDSAAEPQTEVVPLWVNTPERLAEIEIMEKQQESRRAARDAEQQPKTSSDYRDKFLQEKYGYAKTSIWPNQNHPGVLAI